jgi:hypothetical protein
MSLRGIWLMRAAGEWRFGPLYAEAFCLPPEFLRLLSSGNLITVIVNPATMPGRLKVSISTEQGRGVDLKFVGRQREFAIGRQSVDERPHAAHTVGKVRQAAIVLRLVNSG